MDYQNLALLAHEIRGNNESTEEFYQLVISYIDSWITSVSEMVESRETFFDEDTGEIEVCNVISTDFVFGKGLYDEKAACYADDVDIDFLRDLLQQHAEDKGFEPVCIQNIDAIKNKVY